MKNKEQLDFKKRAVIELNETAVKKIEHENGGNTWKYFGLKITTRFNITIYQTE